MLRKSCWVLCLLLLTAAGRQGAIDSQQNNRSGTWAASTTSGLTMVGRWTAVFDPTAGTVAGTWALLDPQGKTVANGGWSAAKAPTQWNGAWRAVVSGRDGEYSGTWTAPVDLKGDARLADLFEKAVQAAVNGTWSAGSRSGNWSIRTAKREGGP